MRIVNLIQVNLIPQNIKLKISPTVFPLSSDKSLFLTFSEQSPLKSALDRYGFVRRHVRRSTTASQTAEVIFTQVLRVTAQGSRKLFTLSPSLPAQKHSWMIVTLQPRCGPPESASRCSQENYSVMCHKDERFCRCRVVS